MNSLQSKLAKTYYNVGDVSDLLEVSVTTVWRWRKQGLLPEPRRIGGMTRWAKADLVEAFPELESRT